MSTETGNGARYRLQGHSERWSDRGQESGDQSFASSQQASHNALNCRTSLKVAKPLDQFNGEKTNFLIFLPLFYSCLYLLAPLEPPVLPSGIRNGKSACHR